MSDRAPERCVLHADADRFYFAVEAIEQPELAMSEEPVIIGHDPRESPRAVVTTANDAARRLGIESGLSCRVALARAPSARFVPPRFPIYREYSRRLMAILREATSTFEPLSIDEAWLDWSHRGFDPARALELREDVRRATGLSVSIGVASSKLLAKMATEAAKSRPERIQIIKPGHESLFLRPLPVEALWGVGPKTAARLRAEGLETIGQIEDTPIERLQMMLGPTWGRALSEHSRGIDHAPINAVRHPKSYSAERTFQADTADRVEIWNELQRQAEQLSQRLRTKSLVAVEVGLKLRYGDWEEMSRQMRLPAPSADGAIIAATVAALMRRNWERGRAIRLIGVRVAGLRAAGEPTQLTIPGISG